VKEAAKGKHKPFTFTRKSDIIETEERDCFVVVIVFDIIIV